VNSPLSLHPKRLVWRDEDLSHPASPTKHGHGHDQSKSYPGQDPDPGPDPDPASVIVHDYSTCTHEASLSCLQTPTLVVAPFALHDAALADLAPHHSLMARLQQEGLNRLALIEWVTASSQTAHHTISHQIDLLDAIVTRQGNRVNLIGLCQGGWLSLIYAALFPKKVRRLVLVGAPIDFHAGLPEPMRLGHALVPNFLSESFNTFGFNIWCAPFASHSQPIIRGRALRWLWPYALDQDWQIAGVLQIPELMPHAQRQMAIRALRQWDQRMLDLPAPYFWQVLQWLYRDNRLVRGQLSIKGERVDLKRVSCPVALLAGAQDTITPKNQLLAVTTMLDTRPSDIRIAIAPCGHLALFMGHDSLSDYWPDIAQWLIHRPATASIL
jgi:poly(3-hydroxyalkanoate) synthetase